MASMPSRLWTARNSARTSTSPPSTSSTALPPSLHRLPPEIRIQIYMLLFPVNFTLHFYASCNLSDENIQVERADSNHEDAEDALRTFHALWVVGGQMLDEASPYFGAGAHIIINTERYTEALDAGISEASASRHSHGFLDAMSYARRITFRVDAVCRQARLLRRTKPNYRRTEWHASRPTDHCGAQFLEVHAMSFHSGAHRLAADENWLREFIQAADEREGFTGRILEKLVLAQADRCPHRALEKLVELEKHERTNGIVGGQQHRAKPQPDPASPRILCPVATPWLIDSDCGCMKGEITVQLQQANGELCKEEIIEDLLLRDPYQAAQLEDLGGTLPTALVAYSEWKALGMD